MAPATKAIAQSESKGRFMERLGLDENNEDHKRIYALMKAEAVEARQRLTAALGHDLASAAAVSIGQIEETAVHNEIIRVYSNASRETRPYYDLGQDFSGAAEENWIIRWMIWHVFRYRDIRNRRNTVATTRAPNPVLRGNDEGVESSSSAANAAQTRSQRWDPVREAWVEL